MRRTCLNTSCKESLHAEMNAISSLPPALLKGADLYVVRVLANGSLANAHPCPDCMQHLIRAGIGRIYFSV